MRAISKARRAMYRGGSVLGDIDALASGDPKKMLRRLWRKQVWKWLGAIGRKAG